MPRREEWESTSINRISAWVTGVRNLQKALLFALLQPNERLKSIQETADFTELMYLQEEMKTMPLGDVWNEFLSREGIPENYYNIIKEYEREVLLKR